MINNIICLDLDAPQTSTYPKNIVQLGVQNTLVCHVTGFFPPSVSISWTKNNVNVTEGINLSQYRPKNDGTFNIFSTLKFTPAEGDIYSCTVNHEALQGQPQTKIWGECNFQIESMDITLKYNFFSVTKNSCVYLLSYACIFQMLKLLFPVLVQQCSVEWV